MMLFSQTHEARGSAYQTTSMAWNLFTGTLAATNAVTLPSCELLHPDQHSTNQEAAVSVRYAANLRALRLTYETGVASARLLTGRVGGQRRLIVR